MLRGLKTVQTVCLMRRILLARKRRPSRCISPFLPRFSILHPPSSPPPPTLLRLSGALPRDRNVSKKRKAQRFAKRIGDHRSFSIRETIRFITTRGAATIFIRVREGRGHTPAEFPRELSRVGELAQSFNVISHPRQLSRCLMEEFRTQ